MHYKLLTILFLTALAACDLIDYHPYDGRLTISERDINSKNIKRIEEATRDKNTVRFVMISDTQRAYDETEEFVKHINNRDSIDFIVHGGDIADFGMKKEYEWTVDILSHLKAPYVALIGNHDIIGNGDQVYDKLFGPENFSFIAHDIKFVCLNTNAIEYDYSHPVPDFSFIKKEFEDKTPYKKTVVVMHAPPGSEQFDNNIRDVFQLSLKQFPSLQFCLHGHHHNVSEKDLFDDGVIYYGCSSIAKRSYLLFTLTPDSYQYEVVYF